MTLEVAPGINVFAANSTRSAQTLGLAVGKRGYALIEASSVLLAVD